VPTERVENERPDDERRSYGTECIPGEEAGHRQQGGRTELANNLRKEKFLQSGRPSALERRGKKKGIEVNWIEKKKEGESTPKRSASCRMFVSLPASDVPAARRTGGAERGGEGGGGRQTSGANRPGGEHLTWAPILI